MKFLRVFLSLVVLFTAGCSQLPFLPKGQPTATATTARPGSLPTPAGTPTPTASPTPAGPETLRIWLPPQFNPNNGTPAGDLMRQRLEEFATRRPGVSVDVRVKALEGPGGMLDALSAASAAAPDALPDLVALPRPILEAAALKGLLHPLDGLTSAMENQDWYEYARQLSQLQKSIFGIPFAGDAQVMIYRRDEVGEAPRDLASMLKLKGPLAFPAADPLALFTLGLYQSAGGTIQDEQGRPSLDPAVLSGVLMFYQQAGQTGLAPSWLAQESSDERVWNAFIDHRASMAVTWASRYLIESSQLPTDTAPASLPTLSGSPFTLATGWVWALASNQPERQALAIQLAEFFTDGSFLAQWTPASGYLPVRSSSLAIWPEASLQPLIGEIVQSAHLIPSTDMMSSLAPVLQQVTEQILNQQGDPASLSNEAVNHLRNP